MPLDSFSDPRDRFMDVPCIDEVPDKALEGLKEGDFFTEKGSVYHYLRDGRIQRYKTDTKELHHPFDIVVFLPDWEYFQRNTLPDFPIPLTDEVSFFTLIGNYLQGVIRNHKGHIVDQQGNKLRTSEDLKKAEGQIYVVVSGATEFTLPVVKNPKVGYRPFEMQSTLRDDGDRDTQRHPGHKIVHVVT